MKTKRKLWVWGMGAMVLLFAVAIFWNYAVARRTADSLLKIHSDDLREFSYSHTHFSFSDFHGNKSFFPHWVVWYEESESNARCGIHISVLGQYRGSVESGTTSGPKELDIYNAY